MDNGNNPLLIDYETVTSLGNDWATTRQKLREGKNGLEPETIHGFETRVGRVDLEPPKKRVPRYHQLAVEALVNLIERLGVLPDRPMGLVAATSKGGLTDFDVRSVTDLHNPGIWSARLGESIPPVKRVSTPTTACATGLSALIQAARWIAYDQLDHVLVVAAESSFEPLLTAGYRNMKALCGPEGMRPFHPNRDGFALAEGAAAVYLQHPRFQQETNNRPRARLTGWAETNDAHHITDVEPGGRGLRDANKKCLKMAGRTPDQVDVLHAHLTTTPGNDSVEQKIVEDWPGKILLQGVKPALGHSVGAAGLIEAVATSDLLDRQQPFPLASDGYKPDQATPDMYGSALTWNLGFGGHHASVLLERVEKSKRSENS